MTTLSRPTKLSEIEQNIKGAYADQTLLTINLQAVTAMFEKQKAAGWTGQDFQQIMLNVQSVMADCGRLGLDMTPEAKQIYLDFRASQKYGASMGVVIMWQGWAKIASAAGFDLNCAVVKDTDKFEQNENGVSFSVNPFAQGNPVGVFAVLTKGAGRWVATLSKDNLEKRKAKSKSGIWAENYWEMAQAKVMRLACQRAGVIAMTAAVYDDDEVYEPLPEEVVPPLEPAFDEDGRPF